MPTFRKPEAMTRALQLRGVQLGREQTLKVRRKLMWIALGVGAEVAGKTVQLQGVVIRTPVDTGRARASWQVGLGKPRRAVPKGGRRRAATDVAAVGSSIERLREDQTGWLTTSLVYMEVLEFGGYPQPVKQGTWNRQTGRFEVRSSGGFSRQAPRGMARVTYSQIIEAFR